MRNSLYFNYKVLKILFWISSFLIFYSHWIYAAEILHEHGLHFECALPQKTQEVVECAKENHPDVLRKKHTLEYQAFSIDTARQIPNPELEVEFTKGANNTSDSMISIVQSIEWGGKRNTRVQAAKAKNAVMNSDLKELQAEVVLQTVLHLHRLRQLEQERQIFKTTIKTLETLIRQQKSLPQLSPEQQVTQSVYRMALMDAKIKSAVLFDEERALEHYFHVSTGHSLDELKKVLPRSPLTWPTISETPSQKRPSPAQLKTLAEEAELNALWNQAKSDTWPRLKIGPMWNAQSSATGRTQSLWGLKLMMDLPVLNQNAPARTFARAGISKNEKDMNLLQNVESHERTEQLKVYRRAVSILKDVPDISTIEKEFKKNESLAQRGLVSGPLLIEFHRQRAELTQSRNQRELKALEALWLIYHYDGRIFLETL